MKRIFSALFALLILSSCAAGPRASSLLNAPAPTDPAQSSPVTDGETGLPESLPLSSETSEASGAPVDRDLSVLTGSAPFAALLAILSAPAQYEGLSVRIRGIYRREEGALRDREICVVTDPTDPSGLREAQIEIPPQPAGTAPGAVITVEGMLGIYTEYGCSFVRIEPMP